MSEYLTLFVSVLQESFKLVSGFLQGALTVIIVVVAAVLPLALCLMAILSVAWVIQTVRGEHE